MQHRRSGGRTGVTLVNCAACVTSRRRGCARQPLRPSEGASAPRGLEWLALEPHGSVNLVKSKQRVVDHGEVFTPAWMVEAMLDVVAAETERIDSRFLEPACGSGNFLTAVLRRKLAAVERKFGRNEFERRHFALFGLMCIYGIELLSDNIAECRAVLLEMFAEYLDIEPRDDTYRAGFYVVSTNLVHGDALAMRTADGQAITFAEWGYLGKGKFQRRDFRLDVLAQMSEIGAQDGLFGHLDKHEIFAPMTTYAPMTIPELARRAASHASGVSQ